MKNSKPKIPFSLIVKQAGLDRAARWMPMLFNCIMFLGMTFALHPDDRGDVFGSLPCYDPEGLFMAFFSLTIGLAVFEFSGALIDLVCAWLRLRKVCS